MIKEAPNRLNVLAIKRRLLLTVLILLLSGSPFFISGIASTKNVEQVSLLKRNQPLFMKSNHGQFTVVKPLWYFERPAKKESRTFEPSDIIMGSGKLDLQRLIAFLCGNNPQINKDRAVELAKIYIEEANSEGVNYEVAFSQMCLETGFLKFNGEVHPSQNNFCGLGVTGKGEKGLSFEDTKTGVRAHIQHLKAYASTQELTNELVDKRFHYVKRGCVTRMDELTGKWASDKKYGLKVNDLLRRLYVTKP